MSISAEVQQKLLESYGTPKPPIIFCPVSPLVRAIPAPTGSTLLVGSTRTYTTIQDALNAANNGDRLLLDPETFTITSTINVNKSVTIEGQGIGLTTVITTLNTVTTMFNVTVSNVVFQNMSIVQNFPEVLSIESVISINNLSATGIYVDHCEISVCELGISIKATEFQITNCRFTYAPLASRPNGYFYIIISSTSGQSIIDNNTFVSDAGNTDCRFIIITNISVSSGTLQGSLLISNNTQLPSPFTLRHLLVMEEYVGTNFELFIVNNTTILEGNVPVLLFNADFTIFKFIAVYSNHVQNTAGKGLIGIDSSSTGTTDVFSSQNIIANQFFTAGWASATVPSSFIVGYNTTVIPVNPSLPLINCTLCTIPNITLDITPLDPCTFGIRGTVTCSGTPVPGTTVSFTSSVAGIGSVSITPNPTVTDSSGNFTATMTASGTLGTVTVIATTSVNGMTISTSASTSVSCPVVTIQNAIIGSCPSTSVTPTITTGTIVTKVPVVLAEITTQVNTDFTFTVPVPVLEIKASGKRLKLTQSLLALPTNKLFLKGFVRKNIQFAIPTTFTGTTVSSTIDSLTIDVPFSCVTDLTGQFITPPVRPRVNTRSKFEFLAPSQSLAGMNGFAAKDVLSMGDLSEFDQVSQEFFNELPFVELISATFTEFDLSIGRTPGTVVIPTPTPTVAPPFEEGTFTMIEEKMVIDITLKVLQNQQIRVTSA